MANHLTNEGDQKISTALRRLFSDGCAFIHMDDTDALKLSQACDEAMKFFAMDTESKLRSEVPTRITGYRPFAYAHAGDPDRPDLNDSFLYWPHRREAIENHNEITTFLDALEAYRLVMTRIVHALFVQLREHYGYPAELGFEKASVLQVNSFTEKSEEELLQQPHEDAVMLTAIWTSAPGLEAVREEGAWPITFKPNELLIMPGGILTTMTGGEIQPFYHQLRNHSISGRKSLMYFVSPDAERPIEPYVRNDVNRDVDVQALVVENPQTFGLAEQFIES
jgi:isopenicillin N synthase-like dioxygenase